MTAKKTIWITGAAGYIGGELAQRLEQAGYRVVGTDKELSVTEPNRLDTFANELRPDVIINCAGIPRRAAGLKNRINAYEVNALGAHNMAVIADAYEAYLVQISTDDVFPRRMSEPVNEFDVPAPRGPYGKSKRAGEVLVRDTMSNHLIVRSSWVYSANQGMLGSALADAKAGKKHPARIDQIASPTSISLYAKFIEGAIGKQATGTYHFTSKGIATRRAFLTKAYEICGYDPDQLLEPADDIVSSEQVLLEGMKLEMLGIERPTWEEDLKRYLEEQGLAK